MREDLLCNKTVGLKPSGIRRFFDIVAEMKDAISLGVGEPDFDTPWHIRDEGIYSLEKGRTFYTSNSGLKELRMEIAAYLKRTQNMDYHYMHEILITVGGSEAIDLAMRAMINPGDEVLIPEPSYVSYQPTVILADGKPVIIELQEKNKFRLTPEELEAAITPKSKLLVMPFPNNPTGAIIRRNLLGADLWREEACINCFASGHEGTHNSDQRFFKGIRDDRLETRLRLWSGAGNSPDDQDSSVLHHVRTDDFTVCRCRGTAQRR